jgi:lysophospholipase L1-like esterase
LPDCDDDNADHIELATVEHSGNEFGEAPARHADEQAGPTQFLQFRTTLPLEATPQNQAPTTRFTWPRPAHHEVHRQRIGLPTSPRAWFIGMFAAWLLFSRAVSQTGVIAGVVLACIAATIGFFSINAFLVTYDRYLGGHAKKRYGVPLIGAGVCLAIGLLADAIESPLLAVVAMVVGLHFPPLIAHWIDPAETAPTDHLRTPATGAGSAAARALIAASTVAVPVLVGIGLRIRGAASLLLLGAVGLLVLVKFKTPKAYPSHQDTPKLASISVAAVIGALLFGVLWPTGEGIGAALSLALTVLSVLGVHLHFVDQHYEPPAHHTAVGRKRWAVLLASAIFAIAAAQFTWRAVADSGVLLLVLVAAAGFGAFLVWPREGTYALILAGMIFAWAVTDTDGERLDLGDDLSGNWHVVLGDSFISGEGADEFVDGTNTRPQNICRRASTAWPNLMAPSGSTDHRTMSFACSGAVLSNIVQTAQHPNATGANAGATSQLDALEVWLEDVAQADGTVSHVFISGGGNDAGFADLIAACLTPSSLCSEQESAAAFLRRANDLGVTKDGVSPLEATYRAAIQRIETSGTAHADGVAVIAATYIDPVSSYIEGRGPGQGVDPCSSLQGGSLLRNEEAIFVNEFRETINRQIIGAVQAIKNEPEITSGRYWVEALSLENALNDRSVCGDDPGINWIDLRPADDNLAKKLLTLDGGVTWSASQLLPTNWVNSSLHPNESGHRSMALVANLCLDALADASAQADERSGGDWGTEWVCADPEPNFNLLAASPCTDQPESEGPFCTKTEAEEETDRVLSEIQATAGKRLGLGLALAVVAGFLFAAFWTLPRVPSSFWFDRLEGWWADLRNPQTDASVDNRNSSDEEPIDLREGEETLIGG